MARVYNARFFTARARIRIVKLIVALAEFVGRTFAAWIILFAVLGYVFPSAFALFAPWIMVLLGIIMFGMGLTISGKDFAAVARRPADVAIGVLAQFILMPAIAVLLTWLIPVSPEVAAGVILVGCCPGGTASNIMAYLSKGDVALSVACTSVTTLMAPFVTPLLIGLLASRYLPVDAASMFLSILEIVLVPLALGLALQKLAPRQVRLAAPLLPLASVAAIMLIVAYAKRKAISIEVGMQNSGLGAALASAHFSPLAAVPSAIFSVWHNISGALLASYFARGRRADETAR